MLGIVILGPSFEDARAQLSQAVAYADLVELRLDYFRERHPEHLQKLLKEFSLPMIFTLRSKAQGGNYMEDESRRLQEIKRLAACRPAYLDLEADIPDAFIAEIKHEFPDIKLIISHHDFKASPRLETIQNKMPKVPGAFYKIALMAHSTADALRLMLAASKNQSQKNLIAISMGESGEISRILAQKVGSAITYAYLENAQSSALGQLSAETLQGVYHYKSIKPHTQLYGLIGDPVSGSIGHLTNNAVMQALNLDAVYVKMNVQLEELQTSLSLMKEIRFRGLSVTMPLKEAIIPYLDEIDAYANAIGAVNTVLFNQERLIGYNTDGMAALDSLEKQHAVKGKKVILIGAGGAARAIAFEAIHRGAHVLILNRHKERAQNLAEEFGCEGDGLERMPECYDSGYDFLINCSSNLLPIDPMYLIQDTTVMDITTKPMSTLFLEKAKTRGCRLVYGHEMFVRQALKQFEIWFPDIERVKAFEILQQVARSVLSR